MKIIDWQGLQRNILIPLIKLILTICKTCMGFQRVAKNIFIVLIAMVFKVLIDKFCRLKITTRMVQ